MSRPKMSVILWRNRGRRWLNERNTFHCEGILNFPGEQQHERSECSLKFASWRINSEARTWSEATCSNERDEQVWRAVRRSGAIFFVYKWSMNQLLCTWFWGLGAAGVQGFRLVRLKSANKTLRPIWPKTVTTIGWFESADSFVDGSHRRQWKRQR